MKNLEYYYVRTSLCKSRCRAVFLPGSKVLLPHPKFSHHRSLPYPAGQPVTLVLPEISYGDVGRLLQLVYLGRVSFNSDAERKTFADLLSMLNINEKILAMSSAAATGERISNNGVKNGASLGVQPAATGGLVRLQ